MKIDNKNIKKIKPLEKRETLVVDNEQWKDKYLRALADYQNLERRTHDTIERAKIISGREFALGLIEVLDDMQAAEIFVKDEGLQLVIDKVKRMLERMEIVEIEVLGKQYDPAVAEAVEVVAGPHDNEVGTIVQKGYMINSEVIRPARVTVTKKS